MNTERIKPGIDPGFFDTPHGLEVANTAIDNTLMSSSLERGACSFITSVTQVDDKWSAKMCGKKAEIYLVFHGTARSFCQSCYDSEYTHKYGETILTREEALIFAVMEL